MNSTSTSTLRSRTLLACSLRKARLLPNGSSAHAQPPGGLAIPSAVRPPGRPARARSDLRTRNGSGAVSAHLLVATDRSLSYDPTSPIRGLGYLRLVGNR